MTPKYKSSYPRQPKNALDRLDAEWHDNPTAFVSCGYDGGVRAVEQLRPVVAKLLGDLWSARGRPDRARQLYEAALVA